MILSYHTIIRSDHILSYYLYIILHYLILTIISAYIPQLIFENGAHTRQHHICYFREHATSAPAELGGGIHNVSRTRASAQALPQAQKLHVHGRGTFGAFEYA